MEADDLSLDDDTIYGDPVASSTGMVHVCCLNGQNKLSLLPSVLSLICFESYCH